MVFAPLGGSHGICERGRSDRAKRAWIRHPTRRGDRHALTFAPQITYILPCDFAFPQLVSAAPGKMCVIDCRASTPDAVIVHFAARFRVSAVGVRVPGQNVCYQSFSIRHAVPGRPARAKRRPPQLNARRAAHKTGPRHEDRDPERARTKPRSPTRRAAARSRDPGRATRSWTGGRGGR